MCNQAVTFLSGAVSGEADVGLSVVCDTISVCSHLVRTAASHLQLLQDVFKGKDGESPKLGTVKVSLHSRSYTCKAFANESVDILAFVRRTLK